MKKDYLKRYIGARDKANVPEGMRYSELEVLGELIKKYKARDILEIGLANASSSLMICKTLKELGGAKLTSIDPYQPSYYRNEGVKRIEEAGYSGMHRLFKQPDYIAMAFLISQGEKFDIVLIDGYHSFDYAFIDIFFPTYY